MPEPVALPTLARLALRFSTPAAWREALLGDLEEAMQCDLEAGASLAVARRRALFEALRSARDAMRPGWGRSPLKSTPPRRPGDPPVHAFLRDLRLSLRGLRRAPTFAAIVTLTLALGIGCLTAFASLFDGVLLQPLPFPEPERLVALWGESTERPGGRRNSSYPDYLDFEAGTGAFEHLAMYHPGFSNLLEDGVAPERTPTAYITPNFFDTLRLPMEHGRALSAADNEPGAEPAMLISAELWRSRFGADPNVLGRVLQVDDTPRTVVGVVAGGLTFPAATDVWMPMTSLSGHEVRGVHSSRIVGRLADGVTLARTQEELAAIAARLEQAYPRTNHQLGMRAEPLHESLVARVRPRLALVAGAACVLLLVVCANISSLLLERSIRRRRDLATRAALGASHVQLLRFFLAESLILVSFGSVLGLAVAAVARRLLISFGPSLPRSVGTELDTRALAFAAALTGGIALLFALIPAASSLGRNLFGRLRVGSVGAEGKSQAAFRSGFVVLQVALAVILTLGAALLVQSLSKLYDVDLGFESRGILTADMEVPTPWVSEEWSATLAFYESLQERLEALPGVVRATAALHHPANPGWSTSFRIEGEPDPPDGEWPEANFRPVALGYFETAGIRLMEGRVFDDRVRSEGPGQMVVNEAFVRAYLGDGRAVGRRILRNNWWIDAIDAYEIIGVVADTRFAGRHRETPPAMYLPHRQDVPPVMTVMVRVEQGLDPLSLAPALRETVWAVDPDIPLGRVSTLEELVSDTVDTRRFLTFLLTAFAAVTLSLAALGLYGTLAYATARRTRELGLRIALGAQSAHLRGMVLLQGLKLTALGVALGLGGAWIAARALTALLFEIEPGDPMTFAAVTLLLAVVALSSGWLPAWRAARVDPCRVLAEE